MSITDIPEQYRPRPARPWWRSRLFLGAVLLVLLLGGGFVGTFLYLAYAAERELRQAVAELDESEPNGWRIEEIEARRTVFPEEQNSALTVLAVHKRLPPNWPVRRPPALPVAADEPEDTPFPPPEPPPPFDDRLSQLPLDLQLDEALTGDLRDELERVFVALAVAQDMADRPAGRFPLNYTGGWLSMLLSSQEARSVANLLRFEAALWAQDGHADRAVRSTRGVLNCARAVGDEPTLISMLIRIALEAVALRSLERVLAQGEPSDAELADFQRLLEDEAAQPLLYNALRGERALQHDTLNEVAAGRMTAAQLGGTAGPPSFADRVESKFLAAGAPGANARLLRLMTERVEIARRPVEEHAGRMKSLAPLRKESGVVGVLVGLLLPAVDKVGEAFVRSQAKLRCAVTATAAERYRQARGRWPATLDDLVEAKLLDAVPLDPFNSAPVRMLRTAEGVMVYTVGFDGKDDGGNLSDDPRIVGTDLGFRLWDVDRRRGPAHEWIPAPREAPLDSDDLPLASPRR